MLKLSISQLGMGKTRRRRRRRRRNRKQKTDGAAGASSKDTIYSIPQASTLGWSAFKKRKKSSYDNHSLHVPWSDLNHDVLFLVMMRLGVVEFYAFSGVCKSWRSLAVSNKNKFIVSKPAMSVHVSYDDEEECHFKDFEGRKFKPIIPHYAGRWCIGVASGYLILLSKKKNDFWLVNLITRDELYFPKFPDDEFNCCTGDVKGILVFLPSKCGWVFVVLNLCTGNLWFSVEGKQEWMKISTPYSINDLHTFKGKIYTIDSTDDQVWLCELKLYPEPELVLLKKESIPRYDFVFPRLVSCGENLYVIDRGSEHPYRNIHELDLGKMKLVSLEKKGKEYAFFHSNVTGHDHVVILPESWVDLSAQYGEYMLPVSVENARSFMHRSGISSMIV